MKDRQELLEAIALRIIRLFYPDIWERLLNTEMKILNEIYLSDFEEQIKQLVNRKV